MTAPPASRRQVEHLEDQLERAFRGGAWHGPAVLEVLEDVDAGLAASRPVAAAHSIGEITGHLTAWIDVTRRRIQGEPVLDLPDIVDWPACEGCTEEIWRAVRRDLDQAHSRLRHTLRGLDDKRLEDPVAGSDPTVRGSLFGLLQHNVYHAGQIVLLKKAARQGRG